MRTAVDARMTITNPCTGVKTPKRKHAPRTYLTHTQVRQRAEKMADWTLLIYVLAYTGLRFGEAAALKVRSVDLFRRRLNVTESMTEVGGRLVTSTPKTHERRSVPYPEFIADEMKALTIGRQPDELLFTSARGAPVRLHTWRRRAFAPAIKDFPVPTPHDLRHTAASLAISAGASVKVVQLMLGHASAAMTLDVYSDLFPDDLEQVSARLGEAREKECGQNVGTSRKEAIPAFAEVASDLR